MTFSLVSRPLGTLLVLLAAAATLAGPAQARREWQAFGGGGDATNKIECPAGQVMVGVEGRAGSWVNAMRILCAPLTGPFTTGAVQPAGGYFGGRPGGGAGDARCPGNTVLNGFNFNLSPDKGKVVLIKLSCIQASGDVFRATFGSYNAPTEGCGKALGFLPKGCDPDEGDRVQNCPQEQFVGLTVRSGADVNAVGVICDWRAPPVPVNPVADKKPIKTTGKARAATAPINPVADKEPIKTTGKARTGTPAPAAGASAVPVLLSVDLYSSPGGEGDPTGMLAAGTSNVALVEPCSNDWCHVRWPGHEGWVYSGADYNSLGR